MLELAVKEYGADATILRIGQIVPSSVEDEGTMLWNPNEMIPLTIRSALTTGALPDKPGNEDTCSWIDMGTLSRCILELAGLTESSSENKQLVYNLVSPRPFSWKNDFIPSLREAGLKFEVVGREEWLKKLKESSVDAEKNPSRKLLGFWEAQGGGDEDRKVVFVTKEAERRSEGLRNMGKVIEGDYVARLLSAWKEVW